MISDIYFMKKALEQGRRGTNLTRTNPRTGCVIVKDGRIIGRGYHKRYGGPHAEINALKDASTDITGSTMFVTLEPCTHTGKTGPCAAKIVERGISRVVVGMEDPDPRIEGIKFLKENGVEVESEVLKEDARDLIKDYLKWFKYQKPYVILKSALSWDGKIATRTGDSNWISSEDSRNFTMKMRGNVGAILAGRGTVNSDNPGLTYRLDTPEADNPLRVVIDGKLKIKESVNLIGKGTLIVTSPEVDIEKKERLKDRGCRIVEISPDSRGKLPPEQILKELAKNNIKSCLIEGGGTTAGSFIRAGEVDRVVFIYGSKIIGGKDAPTAVDGEGFKKLDEALKLKNIERFSIGRDFVMQGDIIQ
ncbi:MAG: bifunctional diaminohydroxyphosphoribosylaminopyrimidine deaminase/5-amino-6-(5-phosphoribosylamino)uracil reductase RibD [Elusimicrobiota bacterium]